LTESARVCQSEARAVNPGGDEAHETRTEAAARAGDQRLAYISPTKS
jgi:hypothetical protein